MSDLKLTLFKPAATQVSDFYMYSAHFKLERNRSGWKLRLVECLM